jgi:hypothetical protein
VEMGGIENPIGRISMGLLHLKTPESRRIRLVPF